MMFTVLVLGWALGRARSRAAVLWVIPLWVGVEHIFPRIFPWHVGGALYAREYGWGERFEGLVAEVVSKFLLEFDPKRDRCWIAERNGEIVGSVLVAKVSNEVAKLRLLLVEPMARGLGIGNRLVQECIHFARDAGYKRLVLWTNSLLHTARHIYEKEGFRLVAEETEEVFGDGSKGQSWELDL